MISPEMIGPGRTVYDDGFEAGKVAGRKEAYKEAIENCAKLSPAASLQWEVEQLNRVIAALDRMSACTVVKIHNRIKGEPVRYLTNFFKDYRDELAEFLRPLAKAEHDEYQTMLKAQLDSEFTEESLIKDRN